MALFFHIYSSLHCALDPLLEPLIWNDKVESDWELWLSRASLEVTWAGSQYSRFVREAVKSRDWSSPSSSGRSLVEESSFKRRVVAWLTKLGIRIRIKVCVLTLLSVQLHSVALTIVLLWSRASFWCWALCITSFWCENSWGFPKSDEKEEESREVPVQYTKITGRTSHLILLGFSWTSFLWLLLGWTSSRFYGRGSLHAAFFV